MKDNIERIFKESLENYAVPYNGAAWETLSKRLDVAPPTPFYKKWWFAASLAVVATTTAILLVNSSDKIGNDQQLSVANINEPEQQNQSAVSANSQSENSTSSSNPAAISESDAITEEPQQIQHERKISAVYPVIHEVNSPLDMIVEQKSGVSDPGTDYLAPKSNGKVPNGQNYTELSLPKTICLNEELEIVNPNKDELVVVTQPNGKQTGVKAGGKASVAANIPGTIKVSSGSRTYAVEVIKAENSLNIIQISDSPYENGVPEVRLEANGAENNVVWTTNAAASTSKGKVLTVHPFKESEFEVTATSKDAMGCTVTEKQLIRLQNRYNLIAENAFNPSSNVPRNRYFMPEALRIRDVAFDLSIIDPKTGSVVFETSDASQGWDGSDMKNGESARAGSIWLWKVVIKNPMPNEPRVYNGTVNIVDNK